MEQFKIVIFGDLPVASKIADWIIESKSYLIKYVIIGNRNPNKHDPYHSIGKLEDYCKNKEIEITSFDDLENKNELFDLGISIRFSKKIPKKIIDLFEYGIVNLHPGLLPDFAGLYSEVHTILEGSKKGGGTMHWITENIDLGPIIKKREFEIKANDTTYTIYKKTTKVLYEIIIEFLENYKFKEEKGKVISADRYTFYNRFSLEDKKDITSLLDEKQIHDIEKYSRAFTFPGHEPAFIMNNGRKIFIMPEETLNNN